MGTPSSAAPISLVAALSTTVAHAEIALPGATFSLHNLASEAQCATEESLDRRIRGQSSSTDVPPGATPLRVEVTIRRRWSGLVAELRTSGRSVGLREIEASRCEGLLDALAVTIAMILDQDADDRRSDPAGVAADIATGVSSVRDSVTTTGRVADERVLAAPGTIGSPVAPSRQGGFSLGSGAELRAWSAVGASTSSAWQLESGLAIHLGRWGLQAGFYWQPTRTRPLGLGQVRTMSIGGLTAACARTGAEWRGQLCLRGSFGGQRVTGEGFDETMPSHVLPSIHLGPSIGFESGTRWIFGLDLLLQMSPWKDSYLVAVGESSRTNQSNSIDSSTMVVSPVSVWLVARVALSTTRNHAR